MKHRLKDYLDISVISALFDERNPKRKSLTESFFKEIENFEIFISNITIAEIEKAPDKQIKKIWNKK